MTDSERDQLYLRLISDAVNNVQRRISLTDLKQFLVDEDEQALTAFRVQIVDYWGKHQQVIRRAKVASPRAALATDGSIQEHRSARISSCRSKSGLGSSVCVRRD